MRQAAIYSSNKHKTAGQNNWQANQRTQTVCFATRPEMGSARVLGQQKSMLSVNAVFSRFNIELIVLRSVGRKQIASFITNFNEKILLLGFIETVQSLSLHAERYFESCNER